MFGSDTLDAAAIGAGAALLGGIVAGLFSIISTWLSNRSKKSELAFEKRLEAFQQISQAISETSNVLEEFVVMASDLWRIARSKQLEELMQYLIVSDTKTTESEDAKERPNITELSLPIDYTHPLVQKILAQKKVFESTYFKYRVYIPPSIDVLIQEYSEEVFIKTDYDFTKSLFTITKEGKNTFSSDIVKIIPKMDIDRYSLTVLKKNEDCINAILKEMHKFIGFK